MVKQWRVGIYARLSRDDERQGESVSIENQKRMLRRYCDQQNWEVVETYADDGWSGTDFRRPAFLRMMEAVRDQEINLVLVKDLSRLGRDYIEVGKYTDYIFPYYHCRFIALNDGVDTLRQDDDIAMIFKNVINDIYARDTSKKIRAVRRANAECGKFMGYKAPYGYQKDPQDKHHLVIDPEAAKVVQDIFDLRQQGNSVQLISERLNEKGVLTPKDYADQKRRSCWCRESVRAILKNEAYIGNLVQLKQGHISYKDRRQRLRPPEAWVRVEGTHEPLIRREVWEAVRALDKKGCRVVKTADPLSSFLFCACCERPLRRRVDRKFRSGAWREYTYYYCREHGSISRKALEGLLERELGCRDELLSTVRKKGVKKILAGKERVQLQYGSGPQW